MSTVALEICPAKPHERAAARKKAAMLHHGGLTMPVRPSWVEAFQNAVLWLDRVQGERGKRSTRVLRDAMHEMVWRGKWLLDDRHAWQVAESAKVSSKWVLESQCALEEDGVGVRIHDLGWKSRHGRTSNVVLYPELLAIILDLIPKGARAATIQFLRRSDVRSQLEAKGVWPRLPEAVTGSPPVAGPSGDNRNTCGRDLLLKVVGSETEGDRIQDPLPTARPPAAEATKASPGGDPIACAGADAPAPPAPAAEPAPVPAANPAPPSVVQDRPSGPRAVNLSPAPSGDETPRCSSAPATPGPAVAGSSRGASATLPARLRGPHVPVRDVIAWYDANGVPRSVAYSRIADFQRAAQKRRHRGAIAETEARAAAAAEDLEDRERRWSTLLEAWSVAAGGADWIASLRCTGWERGADALVVRVIGSVEALEQLRRYRAELEAAGERALGVVVHVARETAP